MMYSYGGDWWWMLLWMAAIVIVIGLVVWAIVAATRRGDDGHEAVASRTPLDIAKERYAKGEITREQFEQLKRDLL